MAHKYIVSHDMGTSSDKAVLVTVTGDILETASRHYPMQHPLPGYAEADPLDWWKAVCETTREVVAESRRESGRCCRNDILHADAVPDSRGQAGDSAASGHDVARRTKRRHHE